MDRAERFFLALTLVGGACLCIAFALWMLGV